MCCNLPTLWATTVTIGVQGLIEVTGTLVITAELVAEAEEVRATDLTEHLGGKGLHLSNSSFSYIGEVLWHMRREGAGWETGSTTPAVQRL